MALYREDIVNIELTGGTIHREYKMHAIGEADAMANRFGVRLFRNGEPVNIGSGQCQGLFMAPDGTNLLISGSSYTSVSRNEAWVQLPSGCYTNEGQFCLAIKLIGGGVTGTMRIVDGVVNNTGSTGAVMPTSQVPTSAEIIAAYDACIEAMDQSVRYDEEQSKTASEKTTARENIGAASAEDVDFLKIALPQYPYGVEPHQMSLFKKSANLFSDFCYHITGGYYRYQNDASKLYPRITETENWQGWLIRVTPETTYAIGPVDHDVEFLKSDGTRDVLVDTYSDSAPNVVTSGEESYWMCLTQKIDRDMSGWMMVEGSSYPNSYVSGHPQWADMPKGVSYVTLFYPSDPDKTIDLIFDASQVTVSIPAGRIITAKGTSGIIPAATLTTGSSKFVTYDTTAGAWTTSTTVTGTEKFAIGWVSFSDKAAYFNANYRITRTKTIAFMGDSITAGVATTKCFHQFLYDRYGWVCLNYGYGGAGYYQNSASTNTGKIGFGEEGMGVVTTPENAFTPNNVVTRLAELTASAIDAIVIFAGTNDWGNNVSVENYISGIEAAFEYCKAHFTSKPVLVMTPIHRGGDTEPNNSGKTLREYADILIEECNKYAMPYVDTMTMSGLYADSQEVRNIFFENNTVSGLHPSVEGHKRIANAIGETLKDIIAVKF